MRKLLLWVLLSKAVLLGGQPVFDLERDFKMGFKEKEAFYGFAYTPVRQVELIIADPDTLAPEEVAGFPVTGWLPADSLAGPSAWRRKKIWLRALLKGDEQEEKTYAFQIGKNLESWDTVGVYLFYRGGRQVFKKSGLALRPGEKEVRDAFNFFRVSVPAGEEVTLLLKLQGAAARRPAEAFFLAHVDTTTFTEWEGYRLSGQYRRDFSPAYGKIIDFALRSVEILPDAAGAYALDEVLEDSLWAHRARYNRWLASDRDTSAYWLRQRIIGNDQESAFHTFLVGNDARFTWTEVDLYVPDRGGRLLHWRTGSKVSPEDKPIDHVLNLFEVFVPAGDTVTLYARVKTAFPQLAPWNFFISRFDRQRFFEKGAVIKYWNGMFQGALWIQLLYSLLLFLVVRERRELFYAVLIVGIQLFFLSQWGYDQTLREWLPTSPEWWYHLMNLGSFTAIFGLLKFTQAFLHLERRLPWSRLLIDGYIALLALMSLFIAVFPQNWAFQAWRFATGFGILLPAVFGIIGSWRRYPMAGVFLFAVSLFVMGSFAHLFSFILNAQSLGAMGTYVFFKVGVLVMLALMALAVGMRNRQYRREKDAAMEKNLNIQEATNQRLRELDRLKDQFLANTSHELRTPLNGIIGLAESLHDGVSGPLPDMARQNLAMIAGSGRRLTNLVNDILDFSKLKNRRLDLRRHPVDLHVAVKVVLALSEPLIGGKDLRLLNAVPEDAPLVDADEDRLQQILHNLVGNAIKFTEAGFVEVGVLEERAGQGKPAAFPVSGDEVVIYVRDTGIGIPKEKQDLIFEEFEQADGSIARSYGGTGLGLAVARQLVELHGGRIWLESAGAGRRPPEGEGDVQASEGDAQAGGRTTFFFSLPLAGQGGTVPAGSGPVTVETRDKGAALRLLRSGIRNTIAGEPADQQLGSKSGLAEEAKFPEPSPEMPFSPQKRTPMPAQDAELKTILIVDDEPVNRQVLENQLRLAGYRVESASGGVQALEMIRKGQCYDLVLLDIMMPKMSGYDVCQQLRQDYLPGELPVVLLTAKNHVTDLVEGFEAGANDYLTKPFLREELLSRIRTHLKLSRISKATGRFVPHQFLNSLGKPDITEVQLGDHEQREVTVLFVDIRDYTTLAELMTPQDNFRFVNSFAGRMGPVIQRHGGFVQQYLGDAIMAIFQERPEAALRATIEMQQTIRDYNKERSPKGRLPIRVGIGMHTGSLIMGIIGDDQRTDAATIADTVNTASRLEGLTKHYGVNILLSQDCKKRLKDAGDFHFRYLGPVQVKGKHQPVDIYECIDGEPFRTREIKMATQREFETGLRHYFRREFSQAATAFEWVLKANPHDTAARLFRQRASEYSAHGVPDNWTGVETMTHK